MNVDISRSESFKGTQRGYEERTIEALRSQATILSLLVYILRISG